jgi:NAD-dependent dihydropyrimidine dehydrogenase PreA subunit
MTHIITGLCIRDGACVEVCPVECIVPGQPQEEWPWYYIDPETCIDCGACVPECPVEAIFPEEDVPSSFVAKGGEVMTAPVGTPGFAEIFDGHDHNGTAVHLTATRTLAPKEVVDLTPATEPNYKYFEEGPGYGR